MAALFVTVVLLVIIGSSGAAPPSVDDQPRFARWLVREAKWGLLATLLDTAPSGYVVSYSDAGGAGVPYFYLSAKDQAGSNLALDKRACLTVTQLAVDGCSGADPQSPFCSKASLYGRLRLLKAGSWEAATAEAALFADHPSFAGFPKNNGTFGFYRMDIKDVVLVNKPAPARAYYTVNMNPSKSDTAKVSGPDSGPGRAETLYLQYYLILNQI